MPGNPVVGGTVLRRAAIQSPNFVTGVSGWTINADGSAEFNGLVIRGTFNGTNYVINSSGEFFYSGTPALGNLVESFTNGTGTDAKGNAYLQGSTSYLSASGIFTASNLNGGVLSYWESATAGGPYTQFADIGFAWNNVTGGSLLLQAGNQVKLGQAGNAVWSEVAQTFGLPVSSLTVTGETWHDMRPLSNSFVGTVAGKYPPQYRLMTDGYVEIAGFVRTPPATANYNGTVFATLPAAYRPGSNGGHQWLVSDVADGAATPKLQVDTTGNLHFQNLPASLAQTTIGIYGRYPLDSSGLILS
jgi:hypothetical protein